MEINKKIQVIVAEIFHEYEIQYLDSSNDLGNWSHEIQNWTNFYIA